MPSTTIKARGFTLIEATAVIVITGIIASIVALFIARPVQGYMDAARRVMLSDMADTALRRMGREIRAALPNSVRVAGSCGSASCYVEFVPTKDGLVYRADLSGTATGHPLNFQSGADVFFDAFALSPLAAAPGDQLVIFNSGQCGNASCNSDCSNGGANAYEGCNRRAIAAIGGTAATVTGVSFTASTPARAFPLDSPDHRAQIVPASGPVSYACEVPTTAELAQGVQGPMVLHRYTGYGWAGTQATPPSGTPSLMADSVSACTFTYGPGVTMGSALLTLVLALTRTGESVTLYHEVHIDNQP